ncbi:MAG: hypothetical protein J6S82_03710 [Bacteroidales bacterium]|nr:hypothetical protein [Bacteroidales bacterium]
MASVTHYLVKSEGIKLPDGTVWGAETKEMLRVVDGTVNRFRVFDVIGKDLIEKYQGKNLDWKEMRELVLEFVNRQFSLGNRVFDENGEIKTFTLTEETYY